MKRLFKLWLEKIVCKHKWNVHTRSAKYEHNGDELPYMHKETLICSVCGKIKRIKL